MTGLATRQEPRTGRLSAEDWAQAALDLIAEQGIAAVAVEPLARRLGVTKGSFYWHFPSRDALLQAALERWESVEQETVFGTLEAVTDPRRRLELMLEAASQPPRARSLYAALAEAADDPVVRRVLNRVASARIAYLESCYREIGLSPALAKSRAVFAYAAYRGLVQLAHEAAASLPTDWPSYLDVVRSALLPSGRDRVRPAKPRRQ